MLYNQKYILGGGWSRCVGFGEHDISFVGLMCVCENVMLSYLLNLFVELLPSSSHTINRMHNIVKILDRILVNIEYSSYVV